MLNKLRTLELEDIVRFFIIIAIVLIVFFILRILNNKAIVDTENAKIEYEKIKSQYSNIDRSNITALSENSNDKLNKSIEVDRNVLDEFFGFCNKKDVESAYNLLTDECKELVYPNIESFKKLYYNPIFNGKQKIYYAQSWIMVGSTYTYEVTIMNDYLSTGKKEGDVIKDYYTVMTVGDSKKINIGEYTGRKVINREIKKKDITAKINYVDRYMDYEIYNITFENNNDSTVYIDTKEKKDTIYLKDENDLKYYAYMYEINSDDLKLYPKNKKNINIKFNKLYSGSSNRKIRKIIFSNIQKTVDKKAETITMEVEI